VPGSDWTAIAAGSRRGYTEHEHLDNLGLIHMNGRVQDPLIGRFLSADPYVPDPWDGQSFNRYSYVRNNPLTRVDPTGFCDRWDPCIDATNADGFFGGGRGIAPNLYGTGALSYTAAVLAAYMWEAGQSPAALMGAAEVDSYNQMVKQQEEVERRPTLSEALAESQRNIKRLRELLARAHESADKANEGQTEPSLWYRFLAWRQSNLDRTEALYDSAISGNSEAQMELALGFVGGISNFARAVARHSIEKHVLGVGARLDDPLFRGLGIRTTAQLARHVDEVMKNPSVVRSLRFGRVAYWHEATGSVLIHNPLFPARSTIFQPSAGRAYFEGLR
jgi:RHS repeat-associated protein